MSSVSEQTVRVTGNMRTENTRFEAIMILMGVLTVVGNIIAIAVAFSEAPDVQNHRAVLGAFQVADGQGK